MKKALHIRKSLIAFGLPLFIIALMVFITKSSYFTSNPSSLSLGITVDLLLIVPLLYLMLIWKTAIPKTTVVLILIVGIVICTWLLPSENQHYLDLFKTWALPVIEFVVLSFVIFNVRKGIMSFKSNKNQSFDFFTTLKSTCYEVLPKGIVMPVVTEIAVFYYGFIYWKKRTLAENEFSYHKNSGTTTLLLALLCIVGIETFVIHSLLLKWSILAAWILTGLSVYSGIQILGFLKSMYKRPISIEHDQLLLRYGIMSESAIELNNIDSVELSSKDFETTKEARKLSFLGNLEGHNIIIHLKEDETLIKIYGIRRKYKRIALFVDDKVAFKNRIEDALK